MGKRGPKPTPTAILNARGSRLISPDEPQPADGLPIKPTWLRNRVAINQWKKLVKELDYMKVLTRIDGNALARYCDTWAKWQIISEILELEEDEKGIVIIPKDYTVNLNCYIKLSATLGKLEADFGLTPSARTRISVKPEPKDKDESKSAEFFRQATG